MKSLIVLRGVSAQGKSSVLNLLRQSLEGNSAYKVVMSNPHPDGYDWTSIVEGSFGKVGIITFGDPGAEEHVNALLNEMAAADVSIIFAASRTHGGVWSVLREFASDNGFKIIATSPLHSQSINDLALIDELNHTESSMLEELIEKLSKI